MAAYMVAIAHAVRDPERLGRYAEAVAPLVARHGGAYRALDFDPTVLEGAPPIAVVIVEFPDAERLRGFYESEDYAPLKAERQQCGDFTMLQVNGV